MNSKRVSVLGVGLDAIDLATTLKHIEQRIQNREPGYVVLAPAHNVLAAYEDAGLWAIFQRSALTVPDGMGVVWFLRLAGAEGVGRVYGPDLLLAACERGLQAGWRHFFLGGPPGLAERLADILRARFPGVQVAGVFAPPFGEMSETETNAMVNTIEAAKPDLLWVALGSPKQERWVADFRDRLSAPVLIGVGAAFDFLAGAKPQAPAWMQRAGLEWLFRLLSEPRRLWRRYAQYPRFALLAVGQLVGLLRFPLDQDG